MPHPKEEGKEGSTNQQKREGKHPHLKEEKVDSTTQQKRGEKRAPPKEGGK